jgi:dTDP-glucose 4,6-dehydratase
VFGDLPLDSGVFTEETPYAPSSPYSASKAASDHFVRAWRETYGLPVVLTNCSNNYGPYHFPEKLIPLVILNALDEKPLPVYGEGANVRDWLHVEDHCRGIGVALAEGGLGEVYNIGGGTELTNLELTRRVLDVVGAGEDMIERVADRLGHDFRYAVDTAKLEGLGWKPQVDFADGLAATIAWYRSNEWWWRPLKGA